jgi:hypothetical protein
MACSVRSATTLSDDSQTPARWDLDHSRNPVLNR